MSANRKSPGTGTKQSFPYSRRWRFAKKTQTFRESHETKHVLTLRRKAGSNDQKTTLEIFASHPDDVPLISLTGFCPPCQFGSTSGRSLKRGVSSSAGIFHPFRHPAGSSHHLPVFPEKKAFLKSQQGGEPPPLPSRYRVGRKGETGRCGSRVNYAPRQIP